VTSPDEARGQDGDPVTEAELAGIADLIIQIARRLSAVRPRDPDVVPLTPVESLVLRYVHRNRGVSVSDVARALLLQPSNTSTALASLAGKGMITRSTGTTDGRWAQLDVTDRALRSIERVQHSWASRVAEGIPEPGRAAPLLATLHELDRALR